MQNDSGACNMGLLENTSVVKFLQNYFWDPSGVFPIFMITAEVLGRSFANFHCQ